MEISDRLLTLYTAGLEQQQNSYVVEVPKNEIESGDLEDGEVYRVAILPDSSISSTKDTRSTKQNSDRHRQPKSETYDDLPVEVGDKRIVEIESIGDQGDGIAKVDRGYVLVVPDTEKGETVRVKLNGVKENVGFAEVVERIERP